MRKDTKQFKNKSAVPKRGRSRRMVGSGNTQMNAKERKRKLAKERKRAQESEKLEKAGTVDFKKHPARNVGTRSRQSRPKFPGRFAFPGARSPRICSISRFGKIFPAIFPGLSRSFPGEPPNRPRKQPQPSRVFCKRAQQCASA